MNVNTKGSRWTTNKVRARAGLIPFPPLNSNTNSVHSESWNYYQDPKTKKAGYKRRVFFPINMAPNFMERKPTMEKMHNRLRASRPFTRRPKRNNLFEPRPVLKSKRSPSSSPDMFENIKYMFTKKK